MGRKSTGLDTTRKSILTVNIMHEKVKLEEENQAITRNSTIKTTRRIDDY